MSADSRKLIAVIGATGQQGGSVVRALHANGEFRVRALTRHPGRYTGLADEVVAADLDRPEMLKTALAGAYGVFAVTNAWEPGSIDEFTQAKAAIQAAKEAGVQHFIWSTLPNVDVVSGSKYHVPHFTHKAQADAAVKAAGFRYHTFVMAPFYYQNLLSNMLPQPQQDGSLGWTLPIDPDARVIHAGDITEIGRIVAGAFAHRDIAGNGQSLPLVGDLLSLNAIVTTLNQLGHRYTFHQVPAEAFATFFPGAGELAEMFGYFEKHTYLGAPSEDRIALATQVAGSRPTDFAAWARVHMPVKANNESNASPAHALH